MKGKEWCSGPENGKTHQREEIGNVLICEGPPCGSYPLFYFIKTSCSIYFQIFALTPSSSFTSFSMHDLNL